MDTLVKYLVDSLQRYENDYSNALCPVQNEPDQSFMGDHTLLRPVTVQEFRMFGTTIMSALNTPFTTSNHLPNPITSIPTPTTEQLERSLPSTSPSILRCLAPPTPPSATYCQARTEQTAVSLTNTIPLAGVCIPDLPRSRGGWHIALRQWYDIDPKTGYALKDWPDAWFKESMREKTGAKRSQRALIAHEYER